jgi:hypothetical protein
MGIWAYGLMALWRGLIVAAVFLVVVAFGLLLLRRFRLAGRGTLRVSEGASIASVLQSRESRIQYLASSIKAKIQEVGRELADVSFDVRLLGIVLCSISIIAFRFTTQWYLVRSMEIGIGIWELSFALLFGVLFSLVPIHGPAGFGTVEAPWVLALLVLNVSKQDAITSGFGLHIVIIIYCTILGLYGALNLRLGISHREAGIRD